LRPLYFVIRSIGAASKGRESGGAAQVCGRLTPVKGEEVTLLERQLEPAIGTCQIQVAALPLEDPALSPPRTLAVSPTAHALQPVCRVLAAKKAQGIALQLCLGRKINPILAWHGPEQPLEHLPTVLKNKTDFLL
jgi:hypothetical protein